MLPRVRIRLAVSIVVTGAVSAAMFTLPTVTIEPVVDPVNDHNNIAIATGPVEVGRNTWGTLVIDGAGGTDLLVTDGSGGRVNVGESLNGNGTIIVRNGANWQVNGGFEEFWIGDFGNGMLSITDGSTVTTADLTVAQNGTGTVVVDGAGVGPSTLSVIGGATDADMRVGNASLGSGQVRVSNGGFVDVGRNLRLAADPSSTGSVHVTGTDGGGQPSRIVSAELQAGAGTASLNITDGALVETGVVVTAEGTAAINVRGHDGNGQSSTLNVDTLLGSGQLVLADLAGSEAALNVSQGGHVIAEQAAIGSFGDGGVTAVNVSGTVPEPGTGDLRSKLILNDLGMGGNFSNSTMRITAGALVTSQWLSVGAGGGTHSLTVSGTDGAPPGETLASGLNISNNIGFGASEAVTTLNVNGGAEVNAGNLLSSGNNGAVAINVTGTDPNGGRSTLGVIGNISFDATGSSESLTISNGGAVSASSISLRPQAGTANVNVSGASGGLVSSLDAAGTLRVEGDASVLNVGDDGQVTVGELRVGDAGGSTGTTRVATGGRIINQGSATRIGRFGRGLLDIQSGGTVDAGPLLFIGRFDPGVGTVVVDGGTLNVEGDAANPAADVRSLVFLGGRGTGTLKVFNGGQVLINRDTTDLTGFQSLRVGELSQRDEIDGTVDGQGRHGTGTLEVSGAGSLLRMLGDRTLFTVGFLGRSLGNVKVTEGGRIVLDPGALTRVGAFAGDPGDPAALPDPIPQTPPAVGHVMVSGPGVGCDPLLDECSMFDSGTLFACGKGIDGSIPDWHLPANLMLIDGGKGTVTVRDGGVIKAAEIAIGPDCVLYGDGTLDGTSTIEGVVIPGNSPGVLTFQGDVSFEDGSVLKIQVTGTEDGQFDTIKVSGGSVVMAPGSSIEIEVAEDVNVAEAATVPILLVDEGETVEGTVEIEVSVVNSPDPPTVVEFEATGSSEIGLTITPEGDLTVSNEVSIDIRPESTVNTIKLGSSGVVPVAILSTSGFNATSVDPQTVTLSGAMVRVVGKNEKLLCHQEDVNFDGLTDLLCQLEISDLQLNPNVGVAVLTALTFTGAEISGRDAVVIEE